MQSSAYGAAVTSSAVAAKPKRILRTIAFDLGANSAFAHELGNRLTVKFRAFEGIREHRAAAYMRWLYEEFSDIKIRGVLPDAIVYERPFARGQHATRSLWGIAGILEAVATDMGWAVLDITPGEIKKFAAGSGKAEKPAMIAAAKKFGYKGANEHEADAVCLLRYAEKHVSIPEGK